VNLRYDREFGMGDDRYCNQSRGWLGIQNESGVNQDYFATLGEIREVWDNLKER